MQIFRHWTDIPQAVRGATAAMGNFDGVHLGHRAVLDAARQARSDAPLGVVTFEPHPREVFAPDAPAFRLMDSETRAHRLEKLGVDILFELPFAGALQNMLPEAFARDVLSDGLGLTHVAIGGDFKFGAQRAGDAVMLKTLGERFDFDTTIVALQGGDVPYSSTAIRRALSEGRPREAASMLGHWHRIDGEVLHGEKRGRELGYPTANMAIDGLHLPALGVYAVTVDVLSGSGETASSADRYSGVASLGVRPMFGTNTPNFEVHLFDFDGDLYGRHLSVGLVAYLRTEEKFDSLDALIAQMDRDSAQARAALADV